MESNNTSEKRVTQWRKDLPPFNRLVVAYLVGSKFHSGARFKRDGFAFMVRHDDMAHTVHDKWASSHYNEALKRIDADDLQVDAWIPLDRPQ